MNDGPDIISYETIVTNGDELVFSTALWFSHGRHFQLQQTFEAFGRRRAAANTARRCRGLEEAVASARTPGSASASARIFHHIRPALLYHFKAGIAMQSTT
jgi:hypothetical protein